MSIKVKVNEPLFNEVKEIAEKLKKQARFIEGLAAIVQNDMEVSEEDLQECRAFVKTARDKAGPEINLALKEWWGKVLVHIGECNKEEA